MKITDILDASGKVDINAMKDKDGKINEEKLDFLINNKPILTPISKERFIEFGVKQNRDRMTEFPDKLPTLGLMPLPVDEHEHIGNYETSHNLYLTIAHAYNELMEYCKKLEQRIVDLERKVK